jgi:hypothetical protein
MARDLAPKLGSPGSFKSRIALDASEHLRTNANRSELAVILFLLSSLTNSPAECRIILFIACSGKSIENAPQLSYA